ncbi:putative gustatory receptor 28b [Periplaneta americana]|uniref:putative gustatory receptor 28b n=1 Tax=Periplaneta americana TaxID=6978 RepID=UPI0037E7560B
MLSFIQIPTNMYTIAEGKESTNYDIALAIWSTSFILRLFITLKICSSTVNEASRTSVIVESMKYRVLHPDIMEELTIFSTHMANEQVKFTSCGLFNMDMPVLISVLAAGLTYLAIMVQM